MVPAPMESSVLPDSFYVCLYLYYYPHGGTEICDVSPLYRLEQKFELMRLKLFTVDTANCPNEAGENLLMTMPYLVRYLEDGRLDLNALLIPALSVGKTNCFPIHQVAPSPVLYSTT